ncbi:MAG: hypothetical protein VKK62_09140, partial [Synechococcaceae cyanobacterium]|nr:hypothetical protein [Synechococcaceae cyanobacterium]
PDAARLFNGNGSAPFSSGLATRQEFYAAMQRSPVRWALRRQMEALCRLRSPRSDFVWTEPPRHPSQFRPTPLASLEEQHLLSDPKAIQRAEQQLLGRPADWGGETEREHGATPPSRPGRRP